MKLCFFVVKEECEEKNKAQASAKNDTLGYVQIANIIKNNLIIFDLEVKIMNNCILTQADSQKCLVDIGELVTNTTNVGYVTLEDGKLKLIGFDGLYGHRGRLELINNVLLITQDDDPNAHDTVLFDDDVLASPIMIDYFKQLEAIDCIFVRVWNVFTQCKGVHVYGK